MKKELTPYQKKLARNRQRRKRARDIAHKAAVGAHTIDLKFEMYRGTGEALEYLRKEGNFEEVEEVITLLIHGAYLLSQRDPSRLQELYSVTSHAQAEPTNDH
ncbi:hypothetical protein [Neptunomonas antarctica]|uniref:Uncharacterized protein n=1 Tax=Neptunomonas antarctica TaxID=619304 RepID=A0A1N7MQB2_9GAMM|nr:hypothetical protein [Neptunomonas antarctica]SIS88208.1 hypothetical protein SAMN05421760_106259 [Neptunomonas antarctica]